MTSKQEYVKKHRHKIKDRAVALLGGKCQVCGYDKCNRALVFHHISDKKWTVGKQTRAWEQVVEELKSCVLVCSNCHMEIHEGLIEAPNPSG